jgi:hypothetical protein
MAFAFVMRPGHANVSATADVTYLTLHPILLLIAR